MKSSILVNCKPFYTGLVVAVAGVLLAASASFASGVSDLISSGKDVSARGENAQQVESDGFVLYFTNVSRVAREGEWSTVAMATLVGVIMRLYQNENSAAAGCDGQGLRSRPEMCSS